MGHKSLSILCVCDCKETLCAMITVYSLLLNSMFIVGLRAILNVLYMCAAARVSLSATT